MHSLRRRLILFSAILPSFIVAIAWFVHRWAKLDNSIAYFCGAVGNLFALVGISILIIMVITGTRLPLIERTFGLDRLMRFHILSGPVVTGIFIIHAVLRFTKVSLLAPDGVQWAFLYRLDLNDIGLTFGKIALAGIIVGAGLARMGRYISSYNFWKPFHFILYAAIPAGFIHAGISGDDIEKFPYNIVFYLLLALFCVTFLNRIYYLYRRKARFIWNFTGSKSENHDTRSLYFERGEGHGPFESRKPGQFALIRYFRSGKWSEPRPFTVSSEPGSDRIALTIKKAGKFTSQIHLLEKETSVLLEGPYGVFSPDFKHEKNLLLIAGGVGITPFLSILRHINRSGEECRATLLWSVKSHDDIIAKDEFEKMSANLGDKLKIVIIITRENSTEAGKEKTYSDKANIVYEYGRINKDIIEKYIEKVSPNIYLCGPKPMQSFVLGALEKYRGIKPASVKRELFFW